MKRLPRKAPRRCLHTRRGRVHRAGGNGAVGRLRGVSLRESGIPDGLRAVGEFLQSVAEIAETIGDYRSDFVRPSGVGESSAQNHEHRTHLETLRRAIQVNRLNFLNLIFMEHVRRQNCEARESVLERAGGLEWEGREEHRIGGKEAGGGEGGEKQEWRRRRGRWRFRRSHDRGWVGTHQSLRPVSQSSLGRGKSML